jgi:murein DD-endopeptidase MepM/ murein hydrolase activator NlpD
LNKSRKRFVTGIAFFLALLMLVSLLAAAMPPAKAVSQSQIDALQDAKGELEDKAKEIQGQIDALKDEQGRYLERKTALDKQNELNREEIDLINQQIELYDQMIEEKAVQLQEAIAEEEAQYQLLCTRMRAMEENGSLSYVAILFKATSFSDLLSRIADINDIMEYDKRLEDDYIASRKNVQEVKAEYEQTQEEQQQYRTELLDKKAQLEEQIDAACEMIAVLEENIGEYTDAYYENAAEEQELQSQIDDLLKQKAAEEEAARKAAAAAAAAAGSTYSGGGNTSVSKGYFIWPTPSCYTVSSPYGYRIHPIFGTERFHSGVDISAGAGAQILASASGTVSIATYSSSYGNYVMISHSNGNATLYAHMSSMLVSVGDTVSQGDVIGYVGSTGWATGPHLHFEIRINNALVDPMTYFN